MTFVADIDMGAKSTKAVIMDGEKRVCAKAAIKTRPDFAAVAREALHSALQQAGITENQVNYIATTGFGGFSISQNPLCPRYRRAKYPSTKGERHRESA